MGRKAGFYALAGIVVLAVAGFLLFGTGLFKAGDTADQGSPVAKKEQATTTKQQTTTEQQTTTAPKEETTAKQETTAERETTAEETSTTSEETTAKDQVEQAAEQTAAQKAAAEQAAREQAAEQTAARERTAAQERTVAREQAAASKEETQKKAWEKAAEQPGQQAAEEAGQQASEPQTQAPASTALNLTVPKMGLYNAPVANSIAPSVLAQGAGKLPSAGYPWQTGSNTYIAGHVYGYKGTGSWQQFAGLPNLAPGDEIYLTDSNGTTYTYRVTKTLVVAPTDTWVAQPVAGQTTVSLQTCTGPGWDQRMIVRGVLV